MKLDIFTHQFDMIKAMGFWEWLSRYPINPVTMVAAALVDPFLAQLVNVKVGDVVLRGNRHYRVNRINMIRNPSS